jgi:hypothetical protein
MREFIYNGWNGVMDYKHNPLRHIPDLQVRHMVMQVLAFMWALAFSLFIIDNLFFFGISAIGHVALIAAVVITVGTFKVAEKRPYMFGSYHSYGRTRGYTIWHDKNGNPKKIWFDKNDPGGEHE